MGRLKDFEKCVEILSGIAGISNDAENQRRNQEEEKKQEEEKSQEEEKNQEEEKQPGEQTGAKYKMTKNEAGLTKSLMQVLLKNTKDAI